jgi:hypothetical protein
MVLSLGVRIIHPSGETALFTAAPPALIMSS